MTLAEILRANGVTDETVTEIMADMKAGGIFTASEENLDIRYGKLKTQHETTTAELTEAQKLIEEMKKSTRGNEGLQQKVAEYETTIADLQTKLAKAELDAAIKVGLLESKATDVDYLTYKLMADGELSIGEDGKIKGWDDKVAGLKTRFPNFFESAAGKRYEEHKLPDQQGGGEPLTKEAILKKPYAERMRIFNENPDGFREAMK